MAIKAVNQFVETEHRPFREDLAAFYGGGRWGENVAENVSALLPESYSFVEILGKGAHATVILVNTSQGFVVVKVPMLRDNPYSQIEGACTLQKSHTSSRDAVPLTLEHKGIMKIHFVIAGILERTSGGLYSHTIDKITDFNQAQGKDVLLTVMPYETKKQSLHQVLKAGSIPSEILIRIAKALLEAISYLHNQNFAHHDINPANLLLDGEMNVTVIDFGLCHWMEEEYSDGTCTYSPPEHYQGGITGHGHDIFSFGVTMFESKHNRSPFLPMKYSEDGCHLSGLDNPLGIYGLEENKDLYDERDPLCKIIRYATQADLNNRPSAALLLEIIEFPERQNGGQPSNLSKRKFHSEDDSAPPSKRAHN